MWVAHCVVKQKEGKENKKGIDNTVCGLHTASLSSFWPPVPLLPILLTLFQPSWVIVIVFMVVEEAGNIGVAAERWWGVVLGIAEVDQAALGWPTYGYWQGHLMVAVDGRAVVVVVWGKRLTMMCWQLDVGVWNDFTHFVSDWLWEFWDVLSKKELVYSFLNGISWKKMENLQKLYYITIG